MGWFLIIFYMARLVIGAMIRNPVGAVVMIVLLGLFGAITETTPAEELYNSKYEDVTVFVRNQCSIRGFKQTPWETLKPVACPCFSHQIVSHLWSSEVLKTWDLLNADAVAGVSADEHRRAIVRLLDDFTWGHTLVTIQQECG